MNPVRRLRQQAGVTQQALAELAGTSQATIAAYETCAKYPTWRTIDRLASALGLEPVVRFTKRMTRSEQQSLILHRAVADRLMRDGEPAIERARAHLQRLQSMHPHARDLLDRWAGWLCSPVDELAARIVDPGTAAREMRQVSPLVGVLNADEREAALELARRERRP